MDEGHITLEGAVIWQYQRERAVSAVAEINGVTGGILIQLAVLARLAKVLGVSAAGGLFDIPLRDKHVLLTVDPDCTWRRRSYRSAGAQSESGHDNEG